MIIIIIIISITGDEADAVVRHGDHREVAVVLGLGSLTVMIIMIIVIIVIVIVKVTVVVVVVVVVVIIMGSHMLYSDIIKCYYYY